MRRLVLIFCLLALSRGAFAGGSKEYCGEESRPCNEYGANVFQERCALCHGSDGHGEGILSMSMKGYPNTNLLEGKRPRDTENLTNIVKHGGGLPDVSTEMPPWGDELTATQVESVVMFLQLLHKDTDTALQLLRTEAGQLKPSKRMGRAIYKGRCSLCHGPYGLGDGKMARIIKDPPPFNLTLSRAPDDYLKQIIAKGGEAMGRSPRMPPWGTDLSGPEIESIILYLKTLRE
jgi:cytochrome c oxidase cbb3-type subunit 3